LAGSPPAEQQDGNGQCANANANANANASDSGSASGSGSDSDNASESDTGSGSDNSNIAYSFGVESFPGKTDYPSKKQNSNDDTHEPTCMLTKRTILSGEQPNANNRECKRLNGSRKKTNPHSHPSLPQPPQQWQPATRANKLCPPQIRLQKIRPPQIRPAEIRPSQRRAMKPQAP
jgi:hypothetical protein